MRMLFISLKDPILLPRNHFSVPTYDRKPNQTQSSAGNQRGASADTSNVSSAQALALSAQEDHGNQAALAAIENERAGDAGLRNYEATLGSYLGPELYNVVKEQLSYSKVCKYSDQLVKSAIKGAASQLNHLGDGVDPAAVNQFGNAIAKEFDGVGCQWAQNQGSGLVDGVRSFALENPEAVVGVAVLAAAGAYAANMDIPTLKHSFDLNDATTLQTSFDIGSLQNVALEKISAKLKYESGNLSMSAGVTHNFNNDDTMVGVGLKYSW
jgi:hypothetical protein